MKQLFIAVLLFVSTASLGQTNMQFQYDAARNHCTSTLEGLYQHSWGTTFFFIDHDFALDAPKGTYLEVSQGINIWKGLSAQIEYNGGAYRGYAINSAYLAGLDYFFHSADYSKTFNIKALYKHIYATEQVLPMQFTAVWNLDFRKGKPFHPVLCGFADLWWERKVVILSEIQFWLMYKKIGIGGEVEVSYNFAGFEGWALRPCVGLKVIL